MSFLEKDDAFKLQAIQNIRDNPLKFARNIIHNVGRLLFSFPYTQERPISLETLIYVVPNGLLIVLCGAGLVAILRRPRATPPELQLLLTFFAFTFAAHSVLSAYPWYFSILVPLIAPWIAWSLADWRRPREPAPGGTASTLT